MNDDQMFTDVTYLIVFMAGMAVGAITTLLIVC